MRSMRIHYANRNTGTINEYYSDFAEIWARDYEERSIFDLWFHVMEHASKVANGIKLQIPSVIIDDLADTAVWLMSFIAFCRKNASGLFELELPDAMIWNKYPGICPACFDNYVVDFLSSKEGEWSDKFSSIDENLIIELFKSIDPNKPCDCVTRVSDKTNKNRDLISSFRSEINGLRLRYASQNRTIMPCKISEFDRMFASMYANFYCIETLDSMVVRMLRSIGEATQAIVNLYTYDDSREPYTDRLLQRRRQRFSEQIADIFGWLFGISIKIRYSYGNIAHEFYKSIKRDGTRFEDFDNINLTDIIWAKYGTTIGGGNWNELRCSACQTAPCTCKRDIKIRWKENVNQSIVNLSKEPKKDLLFVSYSHKDQTYVDAIKESLIPYVRNGSLSFWDDTKIKPGSLWKEEIESALSRAKVALLVVSPSYLASDFINRHELPPLLEAAKNNGTKLAWIPLRASCYKETEIEKYQALCSPSTPLAQLSKANREKVYVEMFEQLKSLFE